MCYLSVVETTHYNQGNLREEGGFGLLVQRYKRPSPSQWGNVAAAGGATGAASRKLTS